MAAINPYLNFDGNTEEAFNFYKSIFGGEFITLQYFKDIPGGADYSESEKNRVMHVSLPIGSNNILMGSDTMPSMGHKLNVGNNFHITINPDSEAEADKIFNALATGGNVSMPLQKTFWGSYFGMLIDKYGIQWMVNLQLNPQ